MEHNGSRENGRFVRMAVLLTLVLAIALVALLALAVAAFFFTGNQTQQEAFVQIYQDGRLIREIPLQSSTTLEITGDYCNTVELRDGRVAITASDCPGGDCVHSGWIHSPGRSIVCLPNRVEIRIVGASDVDFVVG